MSYQPPQQHYGPPQQPTAPWGAPPPPPKKKSKTAPILIGVGAFIVVLIIIGAATGGGKKKDDPAAAPAVTTAQPAAPTTSAAAKKAAPPAKDPAPKVVLTESGNGIKSTVTFTVHGDWDLKYSYDCSTFGYAGNFIVQGSGLTDLYVDELGKKGDDVTHEHDGGKMHLDVNSECSWKIEVIDV